MKKLSIGIFAFTSDEGCIMQVLESFNYKFEEIKDLIDIKHFRLILPNKKLTEIDVSYIEGAISTEKDLERIKEIREKSKKVVAIGSCAITGAPSNQRNFFNSDTKERIKPFLKKFNHFESVEPIDKYIKVDEKIPGCPISEQGFIDSLEKNLVEFGVKNA